jgi:hypothetical protein
MVLLIVFVMSFTIAIEVPIRTGIANANAIIVGIQLIPHRLLNPLKHRGTSCSITYGSEHVTCHVMRRARDWVTLRSDQTGSPGGSVSVLTNIGSSYSYFLSS